MWEATVSMRVGTVAAVIVAALVVAAVVVVGVGAPAGAATKNSTSDAASVEVLQRQLNALGCNAGTIDGKLGPKTVAAVRWFQTAAGITADGIVGVVTWSKLAQAAASGAPNCTSVPAPPAPPTPGAPQCNQDLIKAGSQAALLTNESVVLSGPYQCAGSFTYNAPTIKTAGGRQTQVINLLRWNGTAWQVVNRALYCESGSVPSLIYARTCLSGNTNPKTNPGTSDAASVQLIQRQLNALGCNAGAIDGKLGPRTTAAIRWFQSAAKLTVDGIVGPQTGPRLVDAAASGSPNCSSVPKPGPAPKPSGGPQCTLDAIKAGSQAALNANERMVLSGPYHCAGIWTFNAPTIATAGGAQMRVINLLRWNGTAWQVVNRGAYCEAGNVPAAIYQQTCQVK
jgi:peptidoglycan hydrolase-like protein with peptidoglycan-binding domain